MWYVVQVMTGEEVLSCDFCRMRVAQDSYRDFFVPMYIRKRKYQGIWRAEKKVLFPGYFFVDTEDVHQFAPELTKVMKFTRLLRAGDDLTPVTKQEQEYLSGMMDTQHVVQISTGYVIGEKICITEGPLRNYQGLIKRIDRHHRTADLEISIFGRRTPVQVGLEVLQKVTAEQFIQMKEEAIKRARETDQTKPWVKVLDGTFAGMTGVILRENPKKGELLVGLDIFGDQTPVTFREEEIYRKTPKKIDDF